MADLTLDQLLGALTSAVTQVSDQLAGQARAVDPQSGAGVRYEVTAADFDVSFVVERAESRSAEPPPLPRLPPVALTTRDLASLRRGATERSDEQLQELVRHAEQLRGAFEQARDSAEPVTVEPVPRLDRTARLELEKGAAAAAKDKLGLLLDELEARRQLLELRNTALRAEATPTVVVQVAPEALASAPETSLQRLRVSVRGVPQSIVDVDGQSLPVPG